MSVNYTIRINEVSNKDSNVKAYATVTFGESLAVRNIAVVQKRDSEDLFVSMPSHRTNEVTEKGEPVFRDICNPITKEFYEELTGNILSAYSNRKALPGAEYVIGDGKEPKKIPYNIKISPITREDSSLCGIGRMYIDDSFVINNIRLLNGKNGIFVSLPDYRTEKLRDGKPIYRELVFPVTKGFREELYGKIEKTYNDELVKKDIDQQKQAEKRDSERKAGKNTREKKEVDVPEAPVKAGKTR